MSTEIETADGKILVNQKIVVTAAAPRPLDGEDEHYDKTLAAVAAHLGRQPVELEYKDNVTAGINIAYIWEMDAESIYPKESAFGPSPAEKLSIR